MGALEPLLACIGRWSGKSRLQDPQTGSPDESHSTLLVTPVLGGRYAQLDYTWAYHGEPQEGSLLIGHQVKKATVTAHWIDTWHMDDTVMACSGPAGGGSTISVRGSYAAPPGPDWGWRIDITADEGRALRLLMYNITPDGQEMLAVDASYSRVQD